MDPAKLREPDGVSYLVKALGGQWGKLHAEDKYDLFERALYQVAQKQDESHDSYLARHDAAFEDLLNRKVSLEEVRAYVLMRQSLLNSDERKRVIMDSQGELTYDNARKQIRLLGSRFFQELQAGSGGRGMKLKTYDVNYVDEEIALFHEETPDEVDDELLIATMAEEGDEDANFVQEFEEQIMVACQESSELSGCFMAYQEARSRLKEKARSRGFWPLSGQKGREKGRWNRNKGKGHGFQKGSMGNFGNASMGRRKTLADRIANSTCRRCGKPGHWKRECPLGQGTSSAGDAKRITDGEAFTGIMTEEYTVLNTNVNPIQDKDEEVITQLPANAQYYAYGHLEVGQVPKIHDIGSFGPIMESDGVKRGEFPGESECVFLGVAERGRYNLKQTLVHHLRKCCRSTDPKSAEATFSHEPVRSETTFLQNHVSSAGGHEIFNAEEAADEAIIDTGASRAVIGSDRLEMLVRTFPGEIRSKVMKVPTDGVVFKFGNAGRLSSDYAVLLPRAQNDWLRVEVVPGQTPFLISNAVLGKLRGVVDVESQRLGFKGSDVWIPLFGVRKNLLGVKVMDLLMKTPSMSARAQTHILYTHDSSEGVKSSKAQKAHVFVHEKDQNSSDGIQNRERCFLKENMITYLQQDPVKHHAATVLSEEDTTGEICPEGPNQRLCGHGSSGAVSDQNADIAGGRVAERPSSLSRCSHIPLTTARGGQPDRVGGNDDSVGKAPVQDLCHSVREREVLCEPSVEPEGSGPMVEELPTILPSPSRSQRGESEGGDQEARSSDANLASYDTRGGSSDSCRRSSLADSTNQRPSDQGEGEDGCSKECQLRRGERVDTCVRDRERLQAKPSSPESQHGDSAQCRQDCPTAGADCIAAARSECRASRKSVAVGGGMKILTPNEVALLQSELQEKSHKIQDGLSKLSCDPKYQFQRKSSGIKHGKVTKVGKGVNKRVDLLEIYCEKDSQLTKVCNMKGGRALRFTKEDGDLTTEEGQKKLWTWIELYEPRHVWVAPECRLWGNWARFNMGRSMKTHDQLQKERQSETPHLELCNQIYLHQISHGRHFHLEQPRGSEMICQPSLQDVRLGTLPATFDMCQVGLLQLPSSQDFLQKRTQVFTTSRKFFEQVHEQFCHGTHKHNPIKGKFRHNGVWKSISAYAQAYTAQFARRVVKEILWECQHPERPLLEEEMILGLEEKEVHERPELAQECLQLQKRRRVALKQPESSMYGKAPTWKDVFRTAGYETKRVGGQRFEGDHVLIKLIQQLVPSMDVRLVIACRGTDRHRTDGTDEHGDRFPLRKTVIIGRESGEVVDLGPPEPWTNQPRLKQIRGTGPAKMSLSIFGHPISGSGSEVIHSQLPESAESQPVPDCPDGNDSYESPNVHDTEMDLGEESSVKLHEPKQLMEGDSNPKFEGWIPRLVPKSGPKFLGLERGEQEELRRLHVNLGHPDPQKFSRSLAERGAKPEVVEGSKDMCCDTCVETQNKPKLAQPGRIHSNLDFNDVVGADGSYWRNKGGKVFHFMHFIDEATLFHVGAVSERKVENQIQTYQETWVQWAGPSRLLYLDPAGEYVNDAWAAHLQGDGTQVSMAAAASHWQNGRSEAHGKIVKMVLTRMEKDVDINTEGEFARCLRQVFAAKNSLSRINGFTPEQCLLGKSRHLPGSLVSDPNASSHALADSDTPEGVKFREDLFRREAARKAYVQADNDSAFRRALLRQSRPGKIELEKGDWVLYWRQVRGNSRIERGRWHGPAQVVAVEQRRIVWLSHLGRLIRASPNQVRPASLREYMNLPKGDDGQVMDEKPQGRNYVELVGDPEDGDHQIHGEEQMSDGGGYSPGTPINSSAVEQPEQEYFPGDDSVEENGESRDSGLAPHEIPVPEDDSDDGLFGDDIGIKPSTDGIWEINFNDTEWEPEIADAFCAHPEMIEQVWLTTGEKKKRVEVDYRTQTKEDRALFDAAKSKEVQAWIDHGTVKRVTKGTLSPEQVLRCRWILTWKNPAPGSTERRAKARLVVLGFEDPGLQTVPNDAPTLSKDGKQLLLQQVASRRWKLINFDISTAFLKGHGDGRSLGIHAPPELRDKLGIRGDDQCALMGGAYGRIDAPYLWYKAFRETLENLGFITCPLDGCLFSLVTPEKDGTPKVRGVLGIHVDDGIGGGDSYFHSVLQKLKGIYDFGAYNEGEFEFCGVRYRQWDDGTIEMDQCEYLRRIEPVEIPKHRRADPKSDLTPVEVQQLRRICGSLQFAAVHTRPDLSAKVGQLQSMVTKGQVHHLLEANRVLYEGKKHPVCLMVVPIPQHQVTFCSFSDASFSGTKDLASRQGSLIFSTDLLMAKNERTVVCPIAWSSRRIPRVVTSTLSAEAISLSSALDRLGYIRVIWEWLKNPAVDWSDPGKILRKAPRASAVTDCKSVYDLATKTSTPSCSEYRTTLECLLIRERLQENIAMRWISTQAMLADALTKTMDSSVLRQCLKTGKYSLFDETESLKQRATKRERLQWITRDGHESTSKVSPA